MSPKKILSIVNEGLSQSETVQIIEYYTDILRKEGYYSFELGLEFAADESNIVNWKQFATFINETLKLKFQAFPYSDLKKQLLLFIKDVPLNGTKTIQISYGISIYVSLNCFRQSDDTISVFFKGKSKDNICLNKLEESLSENIQNVVDIGCFSYDFNNREAVASKWICDLLGKDPIEDCNLHEDDMLGLLSRPERYYFVTSVSKALVRREGLDFTFSINDTKGKLHHLKIAGTLCYCDNGNPIKLHGSLLDISDQVELHKQALEDHERLSEFYQHTRILFDSIKDFIWSKDVEGRFVFANHAMCRRILGAKYTEEPIGKSEEYFMYRQQHQYDSKVFKLVDDFDIIGSDKIVLNKLVSQQYELEGTFNGVSCFLEVQKTPVIDAQGKLLGLVGTARDITVRKKFEKELKRSSHRLAESQELAKIGYWEHNFKTEKTKWSKEFYSVFDIDSNSVRPSLEFMSDWIVPEDRPEIVKAYKKAFTEGDSINYTYRISIGNEVKYVRNICKVTQNLDGSIRKVYGTIQDISELKRSEFLAIQNRHRLENIVRALPDLLVIIDKKYNVIEYFLGGSNEIVLPIDALDNNSLFSLFSIAQSKNLKTCIDTSLSKGNIQVNEFPFLNNKTKYHLEFRISPFEEDKVVMVIGDRTAQKQTQVKLENAMLKAEESDRLKSAFIANMSHEIRTPLNAIVGFSNMLGDDDMLPQDKDRFIDIIARNSDQLLALISNIIDVSKIESNQLEMDLSYLDIKQFFKRIHKQFDTQLKNSSEETIQIQNSVPSTNENIIIETDHVRLEQIVSNLINNAIKFTEEGTIEIGYHLQKKGNVVIFVRDTGIGIAKKNQKIIFDQFRQEDFSITRKYGGTGLGLAICKKLAKLMGGDITVESIKGKGSTFSLELPYESNMPKTL